VDNILAAKLSIRERAPSVKNRRNLTYIKLLIITSSVSELVHNKGGNGVSCQYYHQAN